MSDQWGTREQPSERDPGRLRPEHGYLVAAAVCLAVALVAYAADATLPIELNRGAYAILAAGFVAGIQGWLVRSEGRMVRREQAAARAEVAELEALRDQVAQQRVVHLPVACRHQDGQRYMGAAAVGQGGPIPTQRIGLDADTIAAARSVARRMLDSPDPQ